MNTNPVKIQINLWFDNQAEEAARFYTSIFKNSSIGRITRYVDSGQDIHGIPAGTVMTVEFSVNNQEFVALNGGPLYKFNEAVSIIVNCGTQDEIDYYWEKLSAGGDEAAQQCGWLKDKYGLSWQIVPSELIAMTADPDTVKAKRVTDAMLKMKKLDIGKLRMAYNGD